LRRKRCRTAEPPGTPEDPNISFSSMEGIIVSSDTPWADQPRPRDRRRKTRPVGLNGSECFCMVFGGKGFSVCVHTLKRGIPRFKISTQPFETYARDF
jgi:hypothetical protein